MKISLSNALYLMPDVYTSVSRLQSAYEITSFWFLCFMFTINCVSHSARCSGATDSFNGTLLLYPSCIKTLLGYLLFATLAVIKLLSESFLVASETPSLFLVANKPLYASIYPPRTRRPSAFLFARGFERSSSFPLAYPEELLDQK